MALNIPFLSSKKKKTSADDGASLRDNIAESVDPVASLQDTESPKPSKGASFKDKLAARKKQKPNSAKKSKSSGKPKIPKASLRSCFVLIIGDDGGILTYINKGCVARRLFAASPEKQHISPLLELMRSYPKAPIYVLCDMIDQSYVRHSLPPVSPLSVKKLVDRRIARDFAPEDITGSISLGREKTGRKEWNFMLISLANTSVLQQWLDPVLEMPNRFKGIYLNPVEACTFIEQLSSVAVPPTDDGKGAAWKMLVAHDKVGGFRQVVLKDSQLIFTRLTQFSPESPAEVTAGNIEQELQNTIEYLRRLDYDEQDGLELYFIVGQELRDIVNTKVVSASIDKTFTPFEVSQIMDIPQSALSGDKFADVVLSANFGVRQKPRLSLMTAYASKLALLYQLKLGGMVLTALIALYLVYVSAMSVLGWSSLSAEIDDIKVQYGVAQTDLIRAQRRFDALGSDQTKVMRVAELYRKVERSDDDPLGFVSKFSRIKGRTIEVKQWSWSVAEQVQVSKKSRGRKKAAPVYYSYNLTLEVLDHNNDRNVLATNINALVERVNANFEGYEVSVSDLPGEDVSEQESLVIDFSQPAAQDDTEMEPGDEVVTMVIVGPMSKEAAR